MNESLIPLIAVVLGGILTIAAGYFSTLMVEQQRFEREQKSLALAFRGEISAILQLVRDRGYVTRFSELITEIERTGKPIYVPTARDSNTIWFFRQMQTNWARLQTHCPN